VAWGDWDRLRHEVPSAARETINGMLTNCTVDPSASLRAGLAAGLTQVLADGTNTYLHGVARIGEKQTGGWQHYLGDALGSVRQLANTSATVTLAFGVLTPHTETAS